MRGIKESVIVNISSVTCAGNPGQSNYSASKAGLDATTRTWALELSSHGVRVGGIAPGVIDTPILKRYFGRCNAIADRKNPAAQNR